MKKIIVVGGGITGCAIAYYLKKQNHHVEIYEKSDSLGGVLKDVRFSKNNLAKKFLSGPQYINDTDWSRKIFLDKKFKNYIKKIDHQYGSFTDLFDKKGPTILENYALPATKRVFKGIKRSNKDSGLLNRFYSYQNDIYKSLREWTENYYYNLHELHYGCSLPTQTSRVFFVNDEKKINKLKKKDKNADDLLGVPKKENILAYVPKLGYNKIFEIIENHSLKGIKIFYNSKIKIKKNLNNSLEIENKNKKLNADFFVWACNPVSLIKNAYNQNLENAIAKITTFYFNVFTKKKINIDTYFQIFSKNTSINRIYIYKIKDLTKINVECFYNKKISNEKIISQIKKILKKIKINYSKLEFINLRNETRHILVTNKDYNLFKKFNKDPKFNNIIPGGWELYSRDLKVIKITNILKERLKKCV